MTLAAVVGVMSLVARKDPYDEIRRGHLSLDRDARETHEGGPGNAAAGELAAAEEWPQDPATERAERELEIRQMLEARSARRVRNGGEPLDVEAEMERLLSLDYEAGEPSEAGGSSAEQAAEAERAERELEIRQMLEARSARRVRNGGEPLDVEAEMARLLGTDDQV
jgi:hypothetical protein